VAQSPRLHRIERLCVAAVCAFAFALFSLYSAATPLFEASDELWHYPMVMHLATGGGLPEQRKGQTDAEAPWRQEGSQPPFYYAVAALVSAPFDHSNWREIRRINPHADMGVPTRDGNVNAILHSPAEAFPWRGAALAARIARLVSILMSTGTVLASWLVARELFPPSQALPRAFERIATMLFVACVPMFAFISGSINNDNAAALFSTLGLWWALRVARAGDVSARSALIGGVIAAFGVLSKSSVIGVLGLYGLAQISVLIANQRVTARAIGSAARWLAIALGVVLALSGWWFARNLQLYGDLLGWNAFLNVVGRRDSPATLAQLWTEREGFVWAYWGVFGAMNVIMPPIVYSVLNGVAVVALGGAMLSALRWAAGPGRWPSTLIDRDAHAWVLALIWMVVIFVALLRWTALTPASQGRLMFPAIAAIAAVLVAGLARLHRVALLAACVGLTGLAIAAPVAVIAPAYARPADTWERRLSMPVDATFDGAITLVEAQADEAVVSAGGQATLRLNWRVIDATASRPISRNLSAFVHLIDAEDDVIVAQRDMYPGQGNLALSEVDGGYRWSDRYTLKIPRFTPAARPLRWAVGLYDRETGQRLRLPDGSDRAIFGQSTSALSSAPGYQFANGARLDGAIAVRPGVSRGEAMTVTTSWSGALRGPPVTISLQIIDASGNKAAAQDVGLRPDTRELTFGLTADRAAAPGVYRLLLVMYVPDEGGRKVGAYDGAGNFIGEEHVLTQLRVR
jgi:hypothetical protein